MADLKVPAQHRPALKKLSNLDTAAKDKLLQSLEAKNPTLSLRSLASDIASTFDGDAANEIKDIVETIFALYTVRSYLELSIPEFAKGVVGSLDLVIPDAEKANFQKYLIKLLSFETLTTTAKAISVATDHEHVLHDVRILTDMRPIFGEDVKKDPVGITIVHTIKLMYHEGSELNQFFASLDGKDLVDMAKVIERAREKEETLRATLHRTGLICFRGESQC